MKYPILRLPKPIAAALESEMLRRRYHIPHTISVTPSTSYTYYMKGRSNKIGCVIEVSLLLKKKIDPTVQQGRLQFEKRGYVLDYMPLWGGWNGDISSHIGAVNSDKTIRILNPGNAVIKCYVDNQTLFAGGEVILHPTDMPPAISEVRLSDRERLIVFIFGKLKAGPERFLTLEKFKVSQEEINNLVKRKVIKPTKNGYVITVTGLAARSDNPKIDRW